jgi:hypothetical protein
MKFLGDILKRKAPAPAAVVTALPIERDALTELQSDIEERQATLIGLEDEAREADSKLGGIAGLAATLKVQISEGSETAAANLDALEKQELSIRRVREGLNLRIQAMQQEIAPLVARAAELAAAADAIRQDKTLKDLTQRVELMTGEIISHWEKACAVGYDLMRMLDAHIGGVIPLDAEHQRQARILSMSIAKAMLHASLAHANERFQFADAAPFHNLKIVPARRCDEPAPAPAEAASTPDRKPATGLIWSHPSEPKPYALPPAPPALPRSRIAG